MKAIEQGIGLQVYRVHLHNILNILFDKFAITYNPLDLEKNNDTINIINDTIQKYLEINIDTIPKQLREAVGQFQDEVADVIFLMNHIKHHIYYINSWNDEYHKEHLSTITIPEMSFTTDHFPEDAEMKIKTVINELIEISNKASRYRDDLLGIIANEETLNILNTFLHNGYIVEKSKAALATYDRTITVINSQISILMSILTYMNK